VVETDGSQIRPYRLPGDHAKFLSYLQLWSKTSCYWLGEFAVLRKATVSFVMSVRPHGTTRLPLDEYFSKICGEGSGLVKIGQE